MKTQEQYAAEYAKLSDEDLLEEFASESEGQTRAVIYLKHHAPNLQKAPVKFWS